MYKNEYISRETEETLAAEDSFIKYMKDFYDINCTKMPPNFVLDFFMTGGSLSSARAVGEFKNKENMGSIEQYDHDGGIFINEKKITKMRLLKNIYGFSGYIFIRISNGKYYKCKVDDLNFKHTNISVVDNLFGGFNRGGEKERQLALRISSDNFKNI